MRTVFLGVMCLTYLGIKGQAVGYEGKQLMVNYGFHTMLQIRTEVSSYADAKNEEYSSMGLNKRHHFNLEMAVSRQLMFGVSYSFLRYGTKITHDQLVNGTFNHSISRAGVVSTGYWITLRHFSKRSGSIAPLGKYRKYSMGFLWNDYHVDNPAQNDGFISRGGYLQPGLLIEIGRSLVPLRRGYMDFALEFGIIFPIISSSTLDNKTYRVSYSEQPSSIFGINLKFGIGTLVI